MMAVAGGIYCLFLEYISTHWSLLVALLYQIKQNIIGKSDG